MSGAAIGFRAADMVCDPHRAEILHTRLWPAGYTTCADCQRLLRHAPSSGIPLLPHLDADHFVSVHEAGHAVVYLHFGIGVHYATLTPGPAGHVSVDLPSGQYIPAGLWAGMAAVRRLLLNEGTPTDTDLIDVANNGFHDAKLLHRSGLLAREIEAARDHADEIADQQWPAIERVASALLGRGRLSGKEIAALVAPGCTPADGS